jgi:hypothetical protein
VETNDVVDLVGGVAAVLTLMGAGAALAGTRLARRRVRATIMAEGKASPAPTPEALAPYNRRVGKLEARTRNLAMLLSVALGGLGVIGLRRLMESERAGSALVDAPTGRSGQTGRTPTDAAPYRDPPWAQGTEAGLWQPGSWEGSVLRELPGSQSLCRQNCELRLHECLAAAHDGSRCLLFRRVERFVKATGASNSQAWRPPPPR